MPHFSGNTFLWEILPHKKIFSINGSMNVTYLAGSVSASGMVSQIIHWRWVVVEYHLCYIVRYCFCKLLRHNLCPQNAAATQLLPQIL